MDGWIKLHRKLRENPIYRNSTAVHCWIECLLRASHSEKYVFAKRNKVKITRGMFIMGRDEFGKTIGVSGSTAWHWINLFHVDSMIDIKTSSKGTVVTIKNWEEYQVVDSDVDNKKTADEQQKNTNKNVKNDKKLLSKDSNVHEPVRVKKTRDMDIDYLITSYEKNFGFKPTDRKVRQVAYTFKRQINKLLGDLKEARPELTFQDVANISFGWYMKREEKHGETLDVVRRKVTSILFVATRHKYLKGGESA